MTQHNSKAAIQTAANMLLDCLLLFNPAGTSAPVFCSLPPLPHGMGESIKKKKRKKQNLWVKMKVFTKIEKRKKIVIMIYIYIHT